MAERKEEKYMPCISFPLRRLPRGLQLSVIKSVAAQGPETMAKLLLSCSEFYQDDDVRKISRGTDLTKFIRRIEDLTTRERGVLHTYYILKHPLALVVYGIHHFCNDHLIMIGILDLQFGYELGSDLCQYAMGICLLSIDDMRGYIFLRQLFNTKSKRQIQEFREQLRKITCQEPMPFHLPLTNLCSESGLHHWCLEDEVPMRVKEYHITCPDCLIRLEFQKLLHYTG